MDGEHSTRKSSDIAYRIVERKLDDEALLGILTVRERIILS
jgi:hypothetical protein